MRIRKEKFYRRERRERREFPEERKSKIYGLEKNIFLCVLCALCGESRRYFFRKRAAKNPSIRYPPSRIIASG